MEFGLIKLINEEKPMLQYRQTVMPLINKYKPDVMCWEDLKSNRNADVIRLLGSYTGVLQVIAEEMDIPWRSYIPVSIRAKLCAKKTGPRGKGTKTDLAETICNLYDIEFPYDEIFTVYTKGKNKGKPKINYEHEFLNETDAIGIGLYHYIYGNKKGD